MQTGRRQPGSPSRRGWGLIEVVAALAILAGAAVLLFDAQIRSLDQVKHAQDLRQARQLAADLVGQWRRQGYPNRSSQEGTFSEQPQWRWQWTGQPVQPVEGNRQIQMVQVRLAIEKTAVKDVSQGPETILSLSWLVPSLGTGKPNEPAS